MAPGTLCGGWRIVRTMASRITHLTLMQGWCAETGGAVPLFTATWLGVPVSTTHTITGGIIGVGAVRRLSAVRWGVAGDIVIAWLVMIPAAAIVGALCYLLTRLLEEVPGNLICWGVKMFSSEPAQEINQTVL